MDPRETELKFKLPADRLPSLLASPLLAGEETVSQLNSVYFDTADRTLRRRGFTLRVRDTGRGFVQTVKGENGAAGLSRGEWETAVDGPAVDLRALQNTPLGKLDDVDIDALRPLFSTRVERRSRQCRLADALVEAAFDEGEIASGEARLPVREIELELKEGSPAVLFDLGRRLAAEYSAALSLESKGERGYRLADGERLAPRTSAIRPMATTATAIEAFRGVALGCLDQICANAELLGQLARPEALHQLRVGLRRFRAALGAFEAMLAGPRLQALEAELKWLAGQMDDARDLDVLIKGVFRPAAKALDDLALAPLGRRLLEAQTHAYGRALAALGSQRYALLLVEIAAFLELGDWTRAEDPVMAALRDAPAADAATEALDHLFKQVRKRGRGFGKLDAVGRHKLRIRAKRLRYVAEFFGPLHTDCAGRAEFLGSLERMQDRLGALNDLAFARTRLLDLGEIREPGLAFAAGRAVGRLEPDEPRTLRKAARTVKALRAADRFWG